MFSGGIERGQWHNPALAYGSFKMFSGGIEREQWHNPTSFYKLASGSFKMFFRGSTSLYVLC